MWQYVTNNHPVIGIVCHHRYHLFTTGSRIVALVGSIGFGLIVTNCIYLVFVFTNTTDSIHAEFTTNITRTGWHPDLDDSVSVLSISNVNLVLWTIGAFIHGLFDTVIWSLAASGSCCLLPTTTPTPSSSSSSSSKSNNASCRHPHQQNVKEEEEEDEQDEVEESRNRRQRCLAIFVLVELVIFVTAVATLSVALRAALDRDDESVSSATTVDTTGASTTTDGDGIVIVGGSMGSTINTEGLHTSPPTTVARTNLTTVQDILSLPVPDTTSDYEFLVAYMIELGLSYFLYNPVIAIVLFSGILSCGTTPVLGGWPYEMKQERDALQHNNRANSTYTLNTNHTVCSHQTKLRSTTDRNSRPFDIEEEIQPRKTKTATQTKKPAGKSKPALRTIEEPEQPRDATESRKQQTNQTKGHGPKRPNIVKKMAPFNKTNRAERTAEAIFDEVSEECS